MTDSPPKPFPWFALRYWAMAAVVFLVWLLAAGYAAPMAIEALHEGTGVGFLDALMPGRAQTPLGAYLAEWEAVRPSATALVVSLLLLGFPVASLVRASRAGDAPVAEASSPGRGRVAALVVVVSVWTGLAFGYVEAYFVAVKAFHLEHTLPELREVSQDSPWMIPLVQATLLGAVGCLLALGALRWSRRRALAVAVGCAAFLGMLSLLMATGWIAWWAAALLAAGCAWRLARLARRRAPACMALVRRSLPVLLAVPVLAAVSLTVLREVREDRALGRLPPAAPAAPNVLLIVLDTERASSLDLYGYRRPTSPVLNELATRGVVFERAISPGTWTLPSHAQMFTGRHRHEMAVGWTQPLETPHPTLAEVLRDRGYATAGFVANVFYCSDLYGLDRGFSVWRDQPRSLAMALNSVWLSRTAWKKIRHGLDDYQHLVRKTAAEVNREFLDWLPGAPERPWFVFLNYFDAHAPYLPPAPFDTLFVDARDGRYWVGGATADAGLFAPAELDHLRDAYDNGVAYADHALGRLLAALEERGALQNTLVIITSDHGELFGEAGKVGHGAGLHIRLVHVPLLVLPPGGPPEVRRVRAPVSLREIPATVLEATHPGSPSPFPGRSLARHWAAGTRPGATGDTVVAADGWSRMVITDRHHYNFRPGNGDEDLFDLARDPLERDDLSGDPNARPVLRALRGYLHTHGLLAPETRTASRPRD